MTMLPAGVKVHLAYGYTDMRKGMDRLALLVQDVLHQDPFSGHLFVFRGRKANLIKIVYCEFLWGMLRMGVNPTINIVATLIMLLTVTASLVALRVTRYRD